MIRANRKLVLLDLDGTSLDEKSLLSSRTLTVVRKIIAKGHCVCIITGRPRRASINFYNELGLKTILANYNGAYLSNPSDIRFVPLNFVINKEIVKNFLSHPKINRMTENILVECQHTTYMQTDKFPQLNEYFHINQDCNKYIGEDFYKKIDEDVSSIILSAPDEETKWKLFAELKNYSSNLIIRELKIPDHKYTLEVNSKFATKEMAARYIENYYNISNDDTYSFGDSFNDVEVLSYVKNSFAMKNAAHFVKSISRYITDKDNANHGVAHQLQKIFNISDKELDAFEKLHKQQKNKAKKDTGPERPTLNSNPITKEDKKLESNKKSSTPKPSKKVEAKKTTTTKKTKNKK